MVFLSSWWPCLCICQILWHCLGSGLAKQGEHFDSGGPHPGHGHVYAVDCGIAQVPSWLTRGNIATLVVLFVAMFMYVPKIVVLLRFQAC
jgi:hypothetical protein